jgi:hypothetical protein
MLIQKIRGRPLGTQSKRQRKGDRIILLFILMGFGVGIILILYKNNASLKDIIIVPTLLIIVGGLRILGEWEKFR